MLRDDDKAGALIKRPTVAKLSQNPIRLTCFGICFERKQIPRIVENLRKSLNAKEASVISHFGDDEHFQRAEDVMKFWERRTSEVTNQGLLQPGFLHFDLVAVGS